MKRNALLLAPLLAVGVAAALAQAAPPRTLELPDGFKAEIYSSGFEKPRLMAIAPNGDLFLSDSRAGRIYVLPDRNKDGKADSKTVYADGLNEPHGLAFRDGFLYVANTNAVVRFRYASGDTKASGQPTKLVDLPGGGGHSTRTVVFGPDGRMYVSIGSTCNVCEEDDPRRAAVWVYDAEGKNPKPFATGVRNAVGLEWYGGKLYATNNGRDRLGDNIPPESFFVLEEGKFYGWPYCYTVNGKQTFDADFGRKDASACAAAVPAFATTTAHSAPLGLAFYDGQVFPQTYRGLMFVGLHGSWNRSEKSGYKVVTVNPRTGEVRDFATGWLRGGSVSGRPVDLEVASDGSLFLTDDGNGLVYRISYAR